MSADHDILTQFIPSNGLFRAEEPITSPNTTGLRARPGSRVTRVQRTGDRSRQAQQRKVRPVRQTTVLVAVTSATNWNTSAISSQQYQEGHK